MMNRFRTVLTCALFASLPYAVAQTPPSATTPLNLVISGAGGGQFGVDDDLDVYLGGLNGTHIYTDGTALSGSRNSFSFQGSPGQSLLVQVTDTYGYCSSLSPLYISCKGSNTYTLLDPGFPGSCGRAGGNNGISYMNTDTIPANLPGCATTTIGAIEVTQAIQQYQVLSDLLASLAATGEPPVPIISDKPAVFRVYFNTVTDAATVTLNLTGTVNGSKTITLQPNCSPTDQRAGNNGCTSMDFYFTPPSGAWNVTATLNDSGGNQLQQQVLNFTSRDTSTVILRGVSACALYTNANKPTDCGSATKIYGLTTSAANLFPTANVVPVYAFGSLSEYNLDLVFFEQRIVEQANARYGVLDATSDSVGNSYTTFLGIYDSAGVGDTSGVAAGYLTHGATIPDHGNTFGLDIGSDEAAHETAHTLNLFHTGTAIPKATSAPGCYAPAPIGGGYIYPFTDNDLRSSAGIEYGFNVSTQSIINGNNTFDLMGYCTPSWITPFNYKRLITTLNGGAVNSTSAQPVLGVKPALDVHPRTPPPTPVLGPYWQLSGILNPTAGLTLDPVFLQPTYGTSDPGTGTYTLQVRNAAGQPIYSRAFVPATTLTDTAFGDSANAADPDLPYFSQWIPYTAGAASFAVLDPTGAVLTTLPIKGVAPTVVFTNPAGAFTGTGVQTISWTITDPDSSSFTSRLQYSPDNGITWYEMIQTNQSGTTLGSGTIDFSTVPGSTNSLLRVYVTDGVNTGVATSAPFTTPRHLPASVAIITPVSGTTQAANNPVYLSGGAFDADDGILAGKSLVWTSDLQGALGTGSPLSVSLKPGTHTLTLTATDSDGNSLTATSKITLGGAAPTLTLTTTAASPTCTTATVAAVPGAQGAPLSLAQYSLDGGVTYTTIPLASLPFTFLLPANGAIEVVARAYDTSKQYAAQSVRVSVTGACVLQTLSAVSGSGQTTVVGAPFAAPVVAQVLDYTGKGVAGVSVAFTAPATGASASVMSPVVTAADGTASMTPTANATIGTYNVTAAAAGIASTGTFSLTNTDFSLTAALPALNVLHGTSTAETITLNALGGFNSTAQLSCSGLPTGVTCSFAPASLTPTGATATSQLTIAVASNATKSAAAFAPVRPGSAPTAGVVALCSLVAIFSLRRRRIACLLALLVTITLLSASGCASFQKFSSTVTVNARTATATRTATITVNVQ